MKKNILITTLIASIALIPAFAQDVDEILGNYFEAAGQEKLVEVKTMTFIGKIVQMGMEMPFKSITKRPDMAYTEVEFEGSTMKQAYDGQNGWMIAPWTGSDEPIPLTGPDVKQIKDMGDIDTPLWNWKEKGHQLEYTGMEDIEGSKVHVLRLSEEDGNVMDYYFDTESHFIVKTKMTMVVNDSEAEIESFLSNYQERDGIVQPFTIETRMGSQMVTTLLLEVVTFNEEVDDAIFRMPGDE